MYTTTVTWNEEFMANLSKKAQLASRALGNQLDLTPAVQWYAQEVQERLAFTPPKWTGGKRRWTSKKQMRYYFKAIAKRDTDGNIIPYQRTFGLQNDWDVWAQEAYPSGTKIVIENLNPAATFVIGKRQQPMHADTGWPYAPDIMEAILKDTPGLRLILRSWLKYWTGR